MAMAMVTATATSQVQVPCANWHPDNAECEGFGRFTCKNCYLVVYCGPTCQKTHWIQQHKSECKSPVGKETWTPKWVSEDREPVFMKAGVERIPLSYGGKKFLWGNIPAFDVLKLGENEGVDYEGRLRLLFAASGDFRNVIKTITHLPTSYNQPIDIDMNDRDLAVVSRNAILLLIALVVDDIDEAIDCILHTWYSTLIRASDVAILQGQIHPLIDDVCDKIKTRTPDTRSGKTWTFGSRSLRLVLHKGEWDGLRAFLDIPEGLTAERASRIRKGVVMAEKRKDYRDRDLLFKSPARRIAECRFWDDGVLLPFGSPRDDFREPNPTFFQTKDTWPMRDIANPLHGWSSKEVEESSCGPATEDIYGKLFYHVRGVLRAFILRLSTLQVSFRLFQVDASELPRDLVKDSYSRIEVSNISDCGYLGIHRTLELMMPLLQSSQTNPHATLITLFMNVVEDVMTEEEHVAVMTHDGAPTTQRLAEYMPLEGEVTSTSDPVFVKWAYAQDIMGTYDHVFDRFMDQFMFAQFARLAGGAMKEKHTIIEQWPFRLKLCPGEPGAQEEFERVVGRGVSGKERYVEWKRTHI